MYGGSHKFGRGGGGGGRGGGAVKRNNVFPPPPPPQQRLSSSSSSSGRLSLGGRNPPPPSSSSSSALAAEESFSLVGAGAGDPLSFAAIIRLAPDLVDEIKRVETQGGSARIKFDSNPNNPLGNVIDVGGKEFRFTWSHEMGGLCDIYEERQSGEDGNGLLVESGCALRKLNVQRVLDESTKNIVKMRSEEAERKLKSRKAIVLDQCNPSVKSQMKRLAPAEASPWKFKPKKDYQFKKKNFEPPQVIGGPPKPVQKSGFPSTTPAKRGHSTSPLPSPQNQSVSLASPSVRGNATESQSIAEDATPIQARTKENAISSEQEFPARASGRVQDAALRRDGQVVGAMDLQSSITTLLKENPKGMSIKALEKAVGDMASNSARKIEPILKKIATYEPPGRYILKPGVELECLKRPSSDGASSPEDNQQKQSPPQDNHGEVPAPDSGFAGKSPAVDLEEQASLNNKFEEQSNLVEKFDASQHFSDLFGDDEPPDNSEGRAASSSGSGSDSDSDNGSSDSDSSGSRSRSKSPAGSADSSSSDSDSDSSSNSKEGSDVDVDIISDDDKEPKRLQDTEQGLSTTPAQWRMPEARAVQDGNFGDQDGYASEEVDIEKDFLNDNEVDLATAPRDPAISTEKIKVFSPDRDHQQTYGMTDVLNEEEHVEVEFTHDHPDSFVKSKGKSKRASDVIQFEDNAEHVKRFKSGNMAQSSMSAHMPSHTLQSSPKTSPDVTNENHQENHNMQMSNRFNGDDDVNLSMQRGYNYHMMEKSTSESQLSGRMPLSRGIADKSVKNSQNLGLEVTYQEASVHTHESSLKQGDRVTQDEEGRLNEKVNGNGNFKESALPQKHVVRPEPQKKKRSEDSKKSQAVEKSSRLQMGSSPKESGKVDFSRSPVDRRRLQRELSDLELGELREPLPEEPVVTKRQFERVGSFKQSETKSGASASRNADLKGKPPGKPVINAGNPSSPNTRAGVPKDPDAWSKGRSPDPSAEDTSRPSQRVVQSQQQQSRVGRAEVGPLSSKAVDLNKSRHNEAVTNQGTDVEGYGETHKKSHASAQLEDSKQEPSSRKGKGNKSRKSNSSADPSDRKRDVSLTEDHNEKRKRTESSSDENSSYSKYDKEEPELKGPILSFAQYKEYVQEYREKYESYCSLNKILESYRNEFQKLGMDLDSAKGRDMERYHSILAQLRESYRQCGTRHKRLKKIFVVLHEELKHLKERIKDFAAEYTRD